MAYKKTASLVLLPSPPEPPSPESLSAAYRPALEMALQKTSSKAEAAMLVVAVSYPLGAGFVWDGAQALLAGLYSLIVVLSKAQPVETGMDDGPGSVDARVVLLRDDGGTTDDNSLAHSTVLVDLAAFAAAHCRTAWHRIFYPESKAGLQLRDRYLASASAGGASTAASAAAVAGGLTLRAGPSEDAPAASPARPTTLHKTVCLGGTFDYLHPGHKLLLTAGALLLRLPAPSSPSSSPSSSPQQCEYVIGITGDELLRKKKYAELVQPWSKRARAVVDFLATVLDLPSGSSSGASSTEDAEETDGALRATFRSGAIAVQCVRIQDAYGPTIEREDISCLVVSGETRAGGDAVNKKRAEQGWQLLETFVVDVLNADGMSTATESFDAKISSSEIRKRRAERAAAATATAT